jgi:hypothetical protein
MYHPNLSLETSNKNKGKGILKDSNIAKKNV